jgi:hypothetical protein
MTKETTTYNGWRNYETCLVNHWLNNKQSQQDFIEQLRSELNEIAPCFPAETNERLFGSFIREYVEEFLDGLNEWAQVDWREIARAYMEED